MATEQLKVEQTAINGLFKIKTPAFKDSRGWFKEAWQREKLIALGLPDFKPVQCNVSYNHKKGVLRGIHAEPWDKYIFIGHGEVFAAVVDLRKGPDFGKVADFCLSPEDGLFVPEGVGNSYQTLTDNVVYGYLVTAHWRPNLRYPAIDPFDPSLAIDWPIDRAETEISEKDANNPPLSALSND